jgi:spoIIIJ-associated protein
MEMNKDIATKIESRLNELLAFFELTPETKTAEEDGVIVVDVHTANDQIFIGRSVEPLLGLQHLLRLIIRNDFPEERVSLSLSIGGFHQQQRTKLTNTAREAAEQCRSTGTAVRLEPMSSFERRLVHLALVDEVGVKSESEGDGEYRRVVVKADK